MAGYIRKQCSRCGEDLCFQEDDPCDKCKAEIEEGE